MSSNIKVQRFCEFCGEEFTAQTTVTRFCGDRCAKRAYKVRLKDAKIEASNQQTKQIRAKSIEEIQSKEFLTVRDVASLLSCSVRSVYNHIDSGKLKAVNLGQRITRIKRSELDCLFMQGDSTVTMVVDKADQAQTKLSDCYNLREVENKYGISASGLSNLINRHKIPKLKQGKYAFVPKAIIDQLFG